MGWKTGDAAWEPGDGATLLQEVTTVHSEHFRLALEASPTGMLMADASGRILLVNTKIEKLFGYKREELVGQNIELLIPQRFRRRHPAYRKQFFRTPKARDMGAGLDLYGLRRDGSEVPVEIGLNPLTMATGEYVLSSVVDITERRRSQQELEKQRTDLDRKSQEREVLLREVHHRVKNNLQVISSLLNLQADQVAEPRSSELLKESQNRVYSIALVHEQLYQSSDLARINCRKYLGELVVHLLRMSSQSPPITLESRISDYRLSVDLAVPLGLIVNELVTNAFKHAFVNRTTPGNVTVSVQESQEDTLRLVVSDNGWGLPEQFTPNTSNTLGLDLVSKLSRQLGGKLSITRENGTTFSLEFPACSNTSK